MAVPNVPPLRGAAQIAALLDSPEIARLISDLQETRWTGRPGYAIRAMVGFALVKSVYTLPTWSRTVRLVAEHAALRDALGVAPSIHVAYMFTVKLREHSAALADCLDRVLAGLREAVPDLGANLAIDGSDLPVFANGMRDLPNGKPREHYADPDASWGHRSAISTRKGGGFYGYKVHAAVCIKTDLPIAWRVETASASEYEHMRSLLDTAIRRGFTPGTCAMDKGYERVRHLRGLRVPQHPPRHPAETHRERRQRQARTAVVSARRVDVRRVRHQAGRLEVALPDWRMPPGRCGSRPTGCTPSSRAPPTGGR